MRADEFNAKYPIGTQFLYRHALDGDFSVPTRCEAINITPELTTVLVNGMPAKNHAEGLNVNDLQINECQCDFSAEANHNCPFSEEMHGDGKSSCSCCKFCTMNCKGGE